MQSKIKEQSILLGVQFIAFLLGKIGCLIGVHVEHSVAGLYIKFLDYKYANHLSREFNAFQSLKTLFASGN